MIERNKTRADFKIQKVVGMDDVYSITLEQEIYNNLTNTLLTETTVKIFLRKKDLKHLKDVMDKELSK